MSRILRLPFFVLLMGIAAIAMIAPALLAYGQRDYDTSRTFLYAAILLGLLTSTIGIAMSNYSPPNVARSQLLSLVAAFVALPLLLAVPFYEALGTTRFINAWFEMVSSITTTGATLYDAPGRLPDALHLWRALVGWLGGFLIWTTAVAIFAPMNLGGFEIRAKAEVGEGARRFDQITRIADPSERLTRYALRLAPIYGGLTLILWIALLLAGETALTALCHAMSTLSTSGISPEGSLTRADSGFLGELAIFAFLFFALSRLTFSRGLLGSEDQTPLLRDPEFRLGLAFVIFLPLALFLRHWLGAIEIVAGAELADGLRALWGAVFTVLSFLTTTGFESQYWESARFWSGLETPGLLLIGLSLIGGGVATTAGGVKLLRVFALLRHGRREMERLIHPSSIGGAGSDDRRIRRQGAFIAWIFFMLFALSVAGVMVALSLFGVQFETAMVLTVSALSTTGPLAAVAGEVPISYAGIPDPAKVVLAAAMVLGRLETLAIIALLNPDFWRA
ncbi:TrkH family potassium uptake protein [Aestuariibius sp. 2305UL40-4]|uniref:TrkH family potassium uptake protein n=1 Tax=Aestuariibius violaceus TaxID=3234132 RepID=UPI00345EEF9A